MILQLNPPIWLQTPQGRALAYAVIDYGPDHHLLWVTFQQTTGECWTWPNPEIRYDKNPSLGFMKGYTEQHGGSANRTTEAV